jgi:hypothetical protein
MKMTPKRVDVILARYNELLAYAQQAVDGYEVRFDDSGNIEEYVNTACHCHPEYQWQHAMTKEKFLEFLKEKGY